MSVKETLKIIILVQKAFNLDPKNFLIAEENGYGYAHNLGKVQRSRKWADIEIQIILKNARGYV